MLDKLERHAVYASAMSELLSLVIHTARAAVAAIAGWRRNGSIVKPHRASAGPWISVANRV